MKLRKEQSWKGTTLENDRSRKHQSSEPTVCGSGGAKEAGDVNSEDPSDLGANLELDHADTDDCQAQASGICQASLNTELSLEPLGG